MAENQESNPDVIENLALVTDAMQTIFPDGKIICVYELNEIDFKRVQNHFRKIDHQHKRFSIDISGLEHVFIHEEYNNLTNFTKKEEKTQEEPKKEKSALKKISSWFISSGGTV